MPQAMTASPALELNLLKEWREPLPLKQILRDGAASIAIHAVLLAVLLVVLSIPTTPVRSGTVITPLHRAIPLYVPRELTQKAPNQGVVSHSVDVNSSMPSPASRVPRFKPPAPAPGPVAQIQEPTPIEPPKIDVSGTQNPSIGLPGQLVVPAAPPPPTKPKIVMENVGEPDARPLHIDPKLQMPKDAVATAINDALHPSSGALGYDGQGMNTAMQVPQLLSDPNGVDFRPYLQIVARQIEANWKTVLPKGMRGRVSIQFIVDKEGHIVKVVIASPSDTPAFDRFAVAGISRVGQFPSLPAEFRGASISLQVTFSAR